MMEKLGAPAYIPNPLTSPALMVLASTAEATRPTASSPGLGSLSDYHTVYSSPSNRFLDGDTLHRMVLSSSAYQHRPSHLSLYHSQQGSEHYPERVSPEYNPHYFQIHSRLGSGLLHKSSGSAALFNGTSAFRRINPHEHSFSFHHLQHQRSLIDREHSFDNLYHKTSSLELDQERMSKEKGCPVISEKELAEYPNQERSPNASPRSTHSTASNELRFDPVKVKKEQEDEKVCCENTEDGSPDSHRKVKPKQTQGKTPCCPICCITIRPGEMESHYAWEMEKIHEDSRKTRRSQRESAINARKSYTLTVNKRVKQENEISIPNDDTPASTRHQTYLRVCANRMARTGRASKPTRSRSAQSSPVSQVFLNDKIDEGCSGFKSATCPVCESVIQGTGQELNSHVEACLKKRDGNEDTNGQASFEEYEWAGQTRIRATALLEGGFRASGFQTGIKRKAAEEDDGDLNIDGDDSEEYGKPQYSESDIIPCSADEPEEDLARQALRGAVLSCENSPASASRSTPTRSRWSEDEGDGNHSSEEKKDDKNEEEASKGLVINSLKSKVKDLEKQTALEKIKCLICMEPYSIPLVSISCWHVHCEECWLRTLGAKKLCPQCNMITSPSDLRRIFL